MDERITHARLKAAVDWPYFASALFALIPIQCDDAAKMNGMETMGVDARWRMYFHPAIFDKWNIKEISAVMVHEVMHLLRVHPDRIPPDVKSSGKFLIWNLATDCEINDDLTQAGLPQGCIYPKNFEFKEGLMAEEYYRMLLKKAESELNKIKPQVGGGQCGGCSTGEGKEDGSNPDGEGGGSAPKDEDGNPIVGISPQEAEIIRNNVAKEVMSAKSRGNVPSGIVRWAEEGLRSKVPWRTLLSASLRGTIGQKAGLVDYTYTRPSRRQSSYGKIIMPSLKAPIPLITVIVDTSGSMSEKDLGIAIAEVDGVLRSMGSMVTVISNDAEVGAVKRVRSKRDIQLVGGGGTDLGPGIRKASELKPRTSFLIIISDCDAAWGDYVPNFPVVVVKVGQSRSKPPSWIRRVIEVDDI